MKKRKNYEDQVMKTAGKIDSLMLHTSKEDLVPSVQILQFTNGKKGSAGSSDGVESQQSVKSSVF